MAKLGTATVEVVVDYRPAIKALREMGDQFITMANRLEDEREAQMESEPADDAN
jgi:hypothetical protein